MKKYSNSFLLLLAVLALPILLQAQTSSSSSYSRFGLGKLTPGINAMSMAMGGTSIAFRNPSFINPKNPASYTAFDSNSFVFDGAFLVNKLKMSTSTSSASVKDASLGYITMGIPITKWWRSSFGVMPFSSVGYLVGHDTVLANLGKVNYGYSGNGGLNQAYIGNAFQPFRNFSVGFNMSYIFGSINHESTASFPDSANHFSSRVSNSTLYKNLTFDFGMQYYSTFKNGLTLVTGLTYAPQQKLRGIADELAVSFLHNYASEIDVNKDTTVDISGLKGKVILPMNLGWGVSLGRSNRWSAGADVLWQQWSEYKYFGNSDSLKNSLRISLGGQYRPSPIDVGKYFKRVTYRAGLRYEASYLQLRNTRLNEIGISFGMGLPLKKSRSSVNLAFEAGTFGTTDNNLIKENFYRLSVGFALNEKWFLKRKYD